MGVDCTQYVMVAWKTSYEDVENRLSDEKYDEYIGHDRIPGLETVADGMCGEYIMIGKILANLGDTNEETVKIDFSQLEGIVQDVKNKVHDLFAVKDPEVCLYAFNHWS